MVLGVATGPTVVMLIGCNVDISRLPPLPNELPNNPGTPVSVGGTSTTTTTGSTTSSSTTTMAAGPALSLCDCAIAFYGAAKGTPCQTCENTNCITQYSTCAGADCPQATTCLNVCNKNDGPCIAACIDANPTYKALLECLYLNGCVAVCGLPTPITGCDVSDAGTG